jgi:prefoldin beta subunit
MESIQAYEHKKSEKEMVRSELNFLTEGDVIYKLVGPILVKQEHEEAKMNVDKRVEFIGKEMYILLI